MVIRESKTLNLMIIIKRKVMNKLNKNKRLKTKNHKNKNQRNNLKNKRFHKMK